MQSIICSICNMEKHINNSYKKYIDCISKKGLKRNFENKDKTLIQRKI